MIAIRAKARSSAIFELPPPASQVFCPDKLDGHPKIPSGLHFDLSALVQAVTEPLDESEESQACGWVSDSGQALLITLNRNSVLKNGV